MLITQSPSSATIKELIFQSSEDAAKWIEDKETGDIFYWPSDIASHEQIAEMLHISEYDKGIAINDRGTDLYDQTPEAKVRYCQVHEVRKWMAAFIKKQAEGQRNRNNPLDKNTSRLLLSRVMNKFRGISQHIHWRSSNFFH